MFSPPISNFRRTLLNEDKILIEGLKKGSEKAYEHLYETYYKNLVLYCFSLTNKLPQAEDIVQNTLVNIWVKRESITINSSLKSYLYRSVFNGFASEYGKNKRKEKVLIQIKNKVLNNVIDLDIESFEEKIKLLEMAIEQLPKKRREVFLLNKKQGYRYKEIADQLNISEKTVEKHISRAICRIKQLLYSKDTFIFTILFRKVLASGARMGDTTHHQGKKEYKKVGSP